VLLLPFLVLAPIGLDHRITTVEAVVRELGQKTGQTLRIKPELADEVLYVSLKPHSGPELMALIAQAASAEWIQDNGLFLGRSESFRRKTEKASVAALAAEIERIRQPMLDPNDSVPWEPNADRATRLIEGAKAIPSGGNSLKDYMASEAKRSALMPSGRFLSRFIRSIPATELAAIPQGTSVRYVERPNQRQRAFPAGTQVDRYLEERKAMTNDVEALSPERKQEALEYLSRYQTPWTGAVVPLIRISRPMSDRISFSLRTFTNDGQLVDLGSNHLLFESIYSGESLPGYTRWRLEPLIPSGTMEAFVNTEFNSPADPLRPGILKSLTEDGGEPLALFLAQPLDILAKAVGREAIIALPDETARDVRSRFYGKGSLGDFADGLAQSVSFETSGGALVGRARRPIEAAATKTNRAVFRGFMRTLSTGFPGLEAVARYALAQNPGAVLTRFEQTALGAVGLDQLADTTNGLFDLDAGRDVLRAYAGLPSAVRNALRRGETISATQLSPAAREAFETILYRRGSELQSDLPGRYYLDATLLGDHLLTGALLSFSDQKMQNIVGLRVPHGIQTFDTEGLGYVLEQQEEGQFLEPRLGYPVVKTTKFAPGRQETFTMVLRLSKDFAYKSFLRNALIADGAPLVGYDQLPAVYQQEAKKTADFYRKQRRP